MAAAKLDIRMVKNELASILRSEDIDELFAEPHSSGHTDALTGLATRKYLVEFVDAHLSETLHATARPSLILIDIDRFKKTNDSFGPLVCDSLLRSVAQRLRSLASDAKLIARISGDGFALIMKDASAALPLAKTLLEFLSRSYAVEGHVINISVSIGIACADNIRNIASDLMRAANVALHQAQNAGGGVVRHFEVSMLEEIAASNALETDFRAALAALQPEPCSGVINNQFEVHYQPQVSLADGQLCGFEALVRWRHPERGLVLPDKFIPLAEQTGLIAILGDWVLATACRDANLWPATRNYPAGLRVAVNVSPVQLRDGAALVASIQRALHQSGLPAERLEVELTETALASDVGDTLNAIREMGARLALDDFGTGYSSLSRLIQFPFSSIKIDRSFIRSIDCSSHKPAQQIAEKMICAIASMGQELGLITVVEGIETVQQMEIARRAGCTEIQGYLISRAVPSSGVGLLIQCLEDVPENET
jgi:diguanylate cyclase (GGDEF)-like protein